MQALSAHGDDLRAGPGAAAASAGDGAAPSSGDAPVLETRARATVQSSGHGFVLARLRECPLGHRTPFEDHPCNWKGARDIGVAACAHTPSLPIAGSNIP